MRQPYFEHDPMPALFRIVNDTSPPIPSGISAPLYDFLTQCFQKDPNQRPPARKLRTHPWLTAPPEAATAEASASLGGRLSSEGVSPDALLLAPSAGPAASRAPSELPDHILPAPATIHQIHQLRQMGGAADPPLADTNSGRGSTVNWGSGGRSSAGNIADLIRQSSPSIPPPPPPPLPASALGASPAMPRNSEGSPRSHGRRSHGDREGSSPRIERFSAGVDGVTSVMSDTSSIISSLSDYGGSERGDSHMRRYGQPPAISEGDHSGGLSEDVVRVAQRLQQQAAGLHGVYSPLGDHGHSSIFDQVALAHARHGSGGAHGTGGLTNASMVSAGSSGPIAAIVAAFAERPSEAENYDALLEGVQLPDLGKRLQWRLHTPWNGGGGEAEEDESVHWESMAEYRDPFVGIERAVAPKGFGDAAAEARKLSERERIQALVRRLVEAHERAGRERREAMRSRGGAAAMEAMESACSDLHELLSAPEPPAKEAPIDLDGIQPSLDDALSTPTREEGADGEGGGDGSDSRPGLRPQERAALVVSEHGLLPLVHELHEGTGSTSLVISLLSLLNIILRAGGAPVCEAACLLGAIPAVLPFGETHHPQATRLQAAVFMFSMCSCSPMTLQMFISCGGLAALVTLLVQPSSSHELILRAIDSIKAVLDLRGRSPRNDLCRTFVGLEVLELLVLAIPEINASHPRHAERGAEIFVLFSSADAVVKARMATRKVLPGLMQLLASPDEFAPELILKVLRTIKHLCMGEAAQMDELQRAKAIPHLVALLRHAGPVAQRPSPLSPWRGPHYSEMRNQCVNALYLLCQINRSRQEAAAVDGALPILQTIIEAGTPLRQFALPIMCDIAKASKRARAELKQHNGVQFYLGLLSTSYWQEAALDALLVWLNDEPAHVARYMQAPSGVAQLSVVMEARDHAAFVNMLDALSKIVYTSAPTNRALGKIDPSLGHSPFVRVLISRLSHPDARVRRLLLSVLTSVYERHQSPKQLVKLHDLAPLLERVQEADPGVLVRKVASELYEAFKTHDIL